jgi:hypothetical protein
LFRRVLLGAVTALVVVRPLVSGEDPGRLEATEAVSGLILNVLWLVVALGGAVWLALSPRRFCLGGWLSLGLVGATGLILLSAWRCDGYRQPAWFIACEWLVLPAIFILTRELTTDVDAQEDSAGGLLAAILASVVSIAGFAIYQTLADAMRGFSPDLPLHVRTPAPPGDDLRELLPPTVEPRWVARGTLERSDTFFGLLLLVIPLALAYGIRNRSTKARLALATVLILFIVLALAGTDFIKSYFPAQLKDGWATAGKMIRERPWFGVGPGNFDRHAPRLQSETAPSTLAEPWGSYPELAATCGMPALLGLLAFSGWILVTIWRSATRDRRSRELLLDDD